MLRTVQDLLTAVDQLPADERAAARRRVEAAVEGDARSCRVALGLLALDLATPQERAPVRPPRDLEVRVHVLDLDRTPLTATV